MCKKGDIIIVRHYRHGDIALSGHPFVVIKDEAGTVLGFDFDVIALVMSSVKSEEQKEQKMKFPGNFPVTAADKTVTGFENKDGYIKAEQFYFFNSEKTDYFKIGCLDAETWNTLVKFITSLPEKGVAIQRIIDNLY